VSSRKTIFRDSQHKQFDDGECDDEEGEKMANIQKEKIVGFCLFMFASQTKIFLSLSAFLLIVDGYYGVILCIISELVE
jgi:hypothetical protein